MIRRRKKGNWGLKDPAEQNGCRAALMKSEGGGSPVGLGEARLGWG